MVSSYISISSLLMCSDLLLQPHYAKVVVVCVPPSILCMHKNWTYQWNSLNAGTDSYSIGNISISVKNSKLCLKGIHYYLEISQTEGTRLTETEDWSCLIKGTLYLMVAPWFANFADNQYLEKSILVAVSIVVEGLLAADDTSSQVFFMPSEVAS